MKKFDKNLQKFKKIFLNILFPESCIICSKFGEIICKECREEVKKDIANIENIKNIEWIHAFLSYKNKNTKKILFSIKYYFMRSISKYISLIIYKNFFNFLNKNILIKNIMQNEIIIIPIPISKKRLVERSYNQSEIIIKEVARDIKEKENLNLEENIYTDLLLKSKHTVKFAETHSPAERENLIKDAFVVSDKYKNNFLENKLIIIFDDITTTGTTFYEARNTLIASGAKKENILGYAIAH